MRVAWGVALLGAIGCGGAELVVGMHGPPVMLGPEVEDAGVDAGARDAGAPHDAGATLDAGALHDAGVFDAGHPPVDAGASPLDAGAPHDAGAPFDAGAVLDAGAVVDAGPPLVALAGTLDVVDNTWCTVAGWARDPLSSAPLEVDLFADAPYGAPGSRFVGKTMASLLRTDLPFADQNHGFSFGVPIAWADSLTHPLYAYGLPASPMSGTTQLVNSPGSLQCNCRDYTLVDVPWGGSVRTATVVPFAATKNLAVRFTVPVGASYAPGSAGKVTVGPDTDPAAFRQIALSTIPCDFRGGAVGEADPYEHDLNGLTLPFAWASGTNATVRFTVTGNAFGLPQLQPGATYFLNVRNWSPYENGGAGGPSCTTATCNATLSVTTP